jgi:hypothetical protein
MSNLSELQCVAGEYISPAATSVPPLDPVPALPVELNMRPTFGLLRSFFLFLSFLMGGGGESGLTFST